MITPAIKASIDKSVLCWLATSSADGMPNVSPKEIFTHYGDDQILVANIMSPRSVKNIKANPQVCISLLDILVQKGYQIKGTARIISKTDDGYDAMYAPLYEVAGPDFPIQSIIAITIESEKPILAPRYVLFPETSEADQIQNAKTQYFNKSS